MNGRRLILGCGYLGSRVARLWREAGQQVLVLTRSEQRAAALAEQGLLPLVGDITQPAWLPDLPAVDCVLYAVGFDRRAGRTRHEVYVEGLAAALDRLPNQTGKLIYISSTSVYGDLDGQTVDETTVPAPTTEGGQACWAAEQLLAAHPQLGPRSLVLRLSGIYGPGRLPRRDTLLAGEPIPAAADGLLNLIHVDDAARAVLAAEQHGQPGRVYLVSDGNPLPRREYYGAVARHYGAPEPVLIDPNETDGKQERGRSNRFVSNQRLRSELQFELQYPTFAEGLAGIELET